MTTLFSRRLRGVLSIAFALLALPLSVPGTLAAEGLTLTTPYPSLAVSPGKQVSIQIEVETTAPARVDLSLSGVPAGWTAEFHGGGFVVNAVQTDGDEPTEVRLDVDVPEDASGTSRIVVTATSTGTTVTLPIDIRAEANAGGEVTVVPDATALRGDSGETFNFNLTVSNRTEQDLTYTATSQGPVGWTTEVTLTGQAQAVSGTAKAGSTGNIAIRVRPAENAPAASYPIQIVATVGGEQFPIEVTVEITGSYSIDLTTNNQLLSGHGPSGSGTAQSFVITNTGTAPLTKVEMTVTPPTNWKVDFDPTTIESIAPGSSVTVAATITPSGDAIAGDYSLTFNARAAEASDSVSYRFTVEASLIGGIVGAALIVAAIGGLLLVFQRYGRR